MAAKILDAAIAELPRVHRDEIFAIYFTLTRA